MFFFNKNMLAFLLNKLKNKTVKQTLRKKTHLNKLKNNYA